MNGNSKSDFVKEWQDLKKWIDEFPFPSESFHMRNHYVKDSEDLENHLVAKEEFHRALNTLRDEINAVYQDLFGK